MKKALRLNELASQVANLGLGLRTLDESLRNIAAAMIELSLKREQHDMFLRGWMEGSDARAASAEDAIQGQQDSFDMALDALDQRLEELRQKVNADTELSDAGVDRLVADLTHITEEA